MKFHFILLIATTLSALAQTTAPSIVSPDVLSDRRVTFRILAPKASKVGLFGDWMQPGTIEPMSRDALGVWSATVGPLASGISIYNFTVDGIAVADPVNPRVKLRARTSASLVEVPGDPMDPWFPGNVPHGEIDINWEKSAVTGDTRAYYVYTPPEYDRNSSTRYPVVYLLHGNNDTAAGWTDVGKANFIIDNLVARKQAVPMILVMPWGHAVPYDGPQTNNTALVERYLVEEVIPHVEAKYRVAPGRENRAIVGLSMGGGHALQIGLGHLDLFSAVGAFSFAVPSVSTVRFKTFLGDPDRANAQLKLLWLGCGRQDPAFGRNEKFAEMLAARRIRSTFFPREGRHNYDVWRRLLREVAPLLFQPAGATK